MRREVEQNGPMAVENFLYTQVCARDQKLETGLVIAKILSCINSGNM